jgi:hypothetical protein
MTNPVTQLGAALGIATVLASSTGTARGTSLCGVSFHGRAELMGALRSQQARFFSGDHPPTAADERAKLLPSEGAIGRPKAAGGGQASAVHRALIDFGGQSYGTVGWEKTSTAIATSISDSAMR